MMNALQIVLLDNVDSFSFNLVDELERFSQNVLVYRNTLKAEFIADKVLSLAQNNPTVVVLSPGPGAPSDAGCMPELIALLAGKVPILGICLGHQAIVEHFGGIVGRAPQVMHGKGSAIAHDGQGLFVGLPNPLPVARYHSLVATTMPDSLTCLASVDNQVMAVMHKENNIIGLQFHPESILTTAGTAMLANALTLMTA